MTDPEIPPAPAPLIPATLSPGDPALPPNTVFRGPNGIRAGWRVLVFLAISAGLGLFLVLGFALASLRKTGLTALSQLTPLGLSISEGAIFFLTAVPTLIMSRIERRRFGQYGLPLRSAFGGNFWIGVLVGFVSISACLFGIFAFHGFHLTGLAIHGSEILSATVAWGITFILVGLAEEFSFRGYLQFTLTTGMGFWPSAILLSLLFAGAHGANPGESNTGLLSVVMFGLLFCFFLRRTGNLWFPVGFHAGWDWAQTFFYGVPDSGILPYHNLFNCSFNGPSWLTGGSVGPEASVFTFIVLIIVGAAFASVCRQNRYEAP
ncbi:MAG TPA: type II CAAX endopeptidase family protein [Candidatus Sulfotelmatobacter sp.]|jgi:hypothetical protein|nr:type II CAAX endopeptidase family protein [Candidatus Sulfotelmatobacter sp.]